MTSGKFQGFDLEEKIIEGELLKSERLSTHSAQCLLVQFFTFSLLSLSLERRPSRLDKLRRESVHLFLLRRGVEQSGSSSGS